MSTNDDLIGLWSSNKELEKRVIESLSAAIYVTDAKGRLTYFNSAAVEFSGREPQVGTDRWCITMKLYHPDGTPMPHEECPMALSLKENRCINGAEAIAELPNGERRWFKAYPSPLHDDNGDVIGGINMLIDISEKKQFEKKLSQNEQELNDFFENANMGIHWVNADGIIKRANQAELDMLGYSRGEYVGSHIADFHADEDVIDDILTRLNNREELNDYEARLQCKDGSIKHVLINSSVYQKDGKFIHTRCITRDITEWKKTGQVLREKEGQLASKESDMKRLHELSMRLQAQDDVNDTMHEVMMASAELMNADKASVQIYDEKEDVIKLVSTLGFDSDFEEKFNVIDADGITTCAAALKEYEQVHVEDFSNTDKFSEFGEISSSHGMSAVLSTPLFGGDDQFLGVFSMYWSNPHCPDEEKLQLLDLYTQQAARQIERRKSKAKLEAMNETLEERVKKRTKKLRSYQGQLRSLASQLDQAEEQERHRLATELHDKLGQMLAVAKMKVEELQHGNESDQLSGEIEELKQVVNDALTYNQNLMAELKPPPVLNKEDVTEVLYWTAKQVEKQGLDIDIENDSQSKPVDKDIRTTLYQSVRELLQNILKHADVKEARLVIMREKDHVKITVEDNGKGFDVKEDNAMVPTEQGGFGLFNIQERMDWHGGFFEIDSAPGKGTKATLYAPLKEKSKQTAEEEILPSVEKEELQEELQQKIKVLLADDHEMVRRGLRQMIDKQNDLTIVAEASDGQEAVELVRETSPHVVLMDVNMPVMDGIEATKRIKAELPDIRIVGLSLHDSPEVIQDMRSAGASDYLTKNEAFESLIKTIRAEVSA